MNFYGKAASLTSLAIGFGLLTGCVSEGDQQANAQAEKAATNSPLALFSALESHDQELALGILKTKVSQKPKDESGRTPLMVAARTSSTRVAWELLPKKITAALPTDSKGFNALTYAARADEVWLVGELLKRGASPDVTLPDGGSLVAECVVDGRTAVAQLLLKHGADVDSVDADGKPLIEVAARNGQSFLIRDLIKRGVSFEGTEEIGEGTGFYLSHIAAEAGEPELIEILAQNGANLNATNQLGENPIHIAVGSGSFDVLAPLFKQGVSLDNADGSGSSPVHLAVMRRDPDSLRTLLSLGANPNSYGREGKAPHRLRPRDARLRVRQSFDSIRLLRPRNPALRCHP